MPRNNDNDVLNKLKSKILLSNERINLAGSLWQEMHTIVSKSQRKILLDLELDSSLDRKKFPSSYQETFDTYVGLNRLAEDASLVRSIWDTNGNSVAKIGEASSVLSDFSLVLDAQLFQLYAAYSDTTKYRGFNFIPDEWRQLASDILNVDLDDSLDEAEAIRNNYGHALSRQLLLIDQPFGVTRAGIKELSAVLRSLGSRSHQNGDANDTTNYLRNRFDVCVGAFEKLSEFSRNAEVIRSVFEKKRYEEYARTAFRNLVEVYQLPGLYQSFTYARFKDALEFSTKKMNLRVLLQQKLSSKNVGEGTRKEFFGYLDALERDTEFMEELRFSFYRAYANFDKLVHSGKSDHPTVRSQAVQDNLDAIIEINIYNQILTELNLESYHLKYVTSNNSLFAFLFGFEARHVIVPLIHPRYAFFLENPHIDKESREAYDFYTSLSEAFTANAIDRDKTFDVQELSKIQKNFLPLMSAMQGYHAVNFEPGNDVLSEVTRSPVHLIEQLKKFHSRVFDWANDEETTEKFSIADRMRLKVALDDFDKSIESGKLHNIFKEIFGNTTSSFVKVTQEQRSGETFDTVFDVLAELSEGGASAEAKPAQIAIRVHSNKDAEPLRITCLPLQGRYRYVFAIHNTRVVGQYFTEVLNGSADLLGQALLVPQKEFFEAIRTICNEISSNEAEEGFHKQKSIVLKSFLEAFYSAQLGDFQLADVLIDSAIAYACEGEAEFKNGEHVDGFQQILHESHFFKHMVLRARAQTAFSVRSCFKLLIDSRNQLKKSAEMLAKQEAYFFNSSAKISPLGIRVELGKIGLLTEAEVVLSRFEATERIKTDLQASWNNSDFTEISTNVCKELWGFDEEDFGKLGSIDRLAKLQSAVKHIEENISLAHIRLKSTSEKPSFIWEQLRRRVVDQYNFCECARIATDVEISDIVFLPEVKAKKYKAYYISMNHKSAESHENRKVNRPIKTIIHPCSPFEECILAISKLKGFLELPHGSVISGVALTDTARMIEQFASLDDACSRLSIDGLPRFLVRRVKKKLAPNVVDRLKKTEEKLRLFYVEDAIAGESL